MQLASIFVLFALPAAAHAQSADGTFCAMVNGLGGSAERVGDVASGTIRGPAAVYLRREVSAGAYYVIIVALTADASSASVAPAERLGHDPPAREGPRVAHDFHAASSGEIVFSFEAPQGTRYLAALYRVTPAREQALRLRRRAGALLGAPCSDCAPPDCRSARRHGLGSVLPKRR